MPLSLIFAIIPAPALAIQGIGVSPTSQTIELAPGESTNGSLTAINDGDTDVTYHVYTTDYGVKSEDYLGVFTSIRASSDVSPVAWFILPKGNFTVKGHEQLAVPYTLTAPLTAAIGGHYAAVFVETVPPTGVKGTYISRIQRLGSIFYITVKGQVDEQGSVTGFTASPLQFSTPLSADLRVKNNGNVHFLAEGTLQLSTAFGKSGAPVAFHGEVLPGTIRHYSLKIPSSPIGIYHLTATVKYLGHTETHSRYILVMPFLTLLIIVSTLAILVGLLIVLIRRRRP